MTFNDLIDIAVQARKSDHIGNLTLGPKNISFKWGGEDKVFTINEIEKGMSFFKSIFFETFIINDLEALQYVEDGATGTLSNGIEFVVLKSLNNSSKRGGDTIQVRIIGGLNYDLPFAAIKGSTVSQRKKGIINE